MTGIEQVLQELSELRQFATDKVDEGVAPLVVEQARMKESFLSIESALKEIRRARINEIGDSGRLMVTEGRYFGYDALDLAMVRSVLTKRYASSPGQLAGVTKDLDEARTSLTSALTPESAFAWAERAVKERRVAYGFGEFNAGLAKFQVETDIWRAQLIESQRKAMDSTTASSGDELVSTIEAAQLWMDVNLDTVVLPVMQQTPMPSNPFEIPTQLGDTNWYPISENIAATTTDLSTAKVTLTAQGLKTGVPFSDELEEDAIIALIPEIRRNLTRNAAEVIDDVLLNADQTAANGINSDGATITSATSGKAQWLLGFDGLIHLPIVDNTAMGTDKNAAVDADIYNQILSQMGKYAAPKRRGEVLYISDVNTAIRALSIAEFETVDTAGARATLSTGEILSVYGKPYLHTAQMALADTDGKVTDSGNSEDNGRILAFNATQWRVGFRRQITMESEREAGKGQTTLYVSFRIALQERSGSRSTATHTSMGYNITGVS
jgi:HK97 family phage major capsid protein